MTSPNYPLYNQIMQEVRLIMETEKVDEHTATTIRNQRERSKLELMKANRSPAQKLHSKKSNKLNNKTRGNMKV